MEYSLCSVVIILYDYALLRARLTGVLQMTTSGDSGGTSMSAQHECVLIDAPNSTDPVLLRCLVIYSLALSIAIIALVSYCSYFYTTLDFGMFATLGTHASSDLVFSL